MTRKDADAFAARLANDLRLVPAQTPENGQALRAAIQYAASTFADLMTAEHPGFDRDKFMIATGLVVVARR